jgi:hypothetical protein
VLGTIRVSRLGDDKEKKFYAAGSADPKVVYTLRDYMFDRIDRKRADFLELPQPSVSAAPGGDSPADVEKEVPLPGGADDDTGADSDED